MIPLVQSLWLAISSVLFVLWIWSMLSGLLSLSRAARHAAEARGGTWPTLGEQFAEFRRFICDPRHARTRWRLACLTVGLLSMNLLGLLIWGTGPP